MTREETREAKKMTPTEYQQLAKKTLSPESNNLNYLTLGLASEAGEVAGKVKKVIRGDYPLAYIRQSIAFEIGDVLWYCAMLCEFFKLDLGEIMQQNLEKLKDRQDRNVIKGDGEGR